MIIREKAQKEFKSQRWRRNRVKQCLLDRTEPDHYTHELAAAMKTYTKPSLSTF